MRGRLKKKLHKKLRFYELHVSRQNAFTMQSFRESMNKMLEHKLRVAPQFFSASMSLYAGPPRCVCNDCCSKRVGEFDNA
jgi:hypothetical protein